MINTLIEVYMQKRDKSGRYLKGKIVKKKSKKAKKVVLKKTSKKVRVLTQKTKKRNSKLKIPISNLNFDDLADMIRSEVIFQMGNQW